MKATNPIVRCFALAALTIALVVGTASRGFADNKEQIKGTITARLANGFVMQTYEGTSVTVALVEETKLKVDDGPGDWAASDLVPGLPLKVEGTWDAQRTTFVAHKIKFTVKDRRLAWAIKAGLTATDEQVARNTAALQQHGMTLDEHGQALANHGRELEDHSNKIVATTGAIATTNDRIGRLDDYNVIESFTVYFRNGQVRVPAKYVPQLQEFANKAKGVEGYMVQVQGFASAPGAPVFNTNLSHLRAEAVTAILQQGGIPGTNMFVPVAMGETQPVADNHTAKGQAENRRVVVTILQNKGIVKQ